MILPVLQIRLIFLFKNSAVRQDSQIADQHGDNRSTDLRLYRRRDEPGRLHVERVFRARLHCRFRVAGKCRWAVLLARESQRPDRWETILHLEMSFVSGNAAAVHRAHNHPRDVAIQDRSRQLGDPLLDGTGRSHGIVVPGVGLCLHIRRRMAVLSA